MEPKCTDAGVGNLDEFKTHTWQITDGVTGTTETSNEDLIILITEAHSTILGHVGSNSLVVLLELDSNALTHGRVGLLSLDTDFVDDDSSSVRATSERLFPLGDLVSCLILLIGPSIAKEKLELSSLHGQVCATTYKLRRLFTRSLRPALIPRGLWLPIVQI